jgi:hypothetical protein
MRVRQYAYFGISSQQLTATVMTGRLGIEPDRILVRGSPGPTPPVPRFHSWRILCAEPGLTVDAQIAKVVARIQPRQDEIALLASKLSSEDPPGQIALVVVRYFNDEDGEVEVPRGSLVHEQGLESLPGQHQLLGWHLDADVLAFLLAVGASLDIDEFG